MPKKANIENIVNAVRPTTNSNCANIVDATTPKISIAVTAYFIYIYLIGYNVRAVYLHAQV